MNKDQFIMISVALEAGLFFVAFALGWLTDISPNEHFKPNLWVIPLSILWTMPLVAASNYCSKLKWKPFQEMKEYLTFEIGPMLAKMNHLELLILGLFVGVCEETLFRGFTQPWIEQLTQSYWLGLIVGNIIFALLHPVSRLYILYVFIAGIYLGLLLDITGTRELTLPILVHGLYDWAMFVLIRQDYAKTINTT
jgi:membrane protease YdiL (CAAX protease family)